MTCRFTERVYLKTRAGFIKFLGAFAQKKRVEKKSSQVLGTYKHGGGWKENPGTKWVNRCK